MTINDEMDYATFCTAKRIGVTPAGIVAYFGSGNAAQMELRYQAERAAGLITISHHDDAQGCGACGKKHCICRPATRDEWNRELR